MLVGGSCRYSYFGRVLDSVGVLGFIGLGDVGYGFVLWFLSYMVFLGFRIFIFNVLLGRRVMCWVSVIRLVGWFWNWGFILEVVLVSICRIFWGGFVWELGFLLGW